MKVTLEKHGGLAAAIQLRLPPKELDSAALPANDAAELAGLVAEAVSAGPAAEEDRPGRARDAMSYTITVEEDGRSTTVLTQSDTAMSPGFAALLRWLETH
ncbi:protealysin inhibitor emfourin [Streptomyces graminilatus]|uniref:protealysin inhibitor emfourin n=1 Tax=Streptomyces graminilatus TaxID=1464070 RepID=UPI0006E13CAE|nr:protealysin inhibitor emfourin [Streptomyces graminilatus]